MFISCHLRATPKEKSQSSINKACFFHRPTFRSDYWLLLTHVIVIWSCRIFHICLSFKSSYVKALQCMFTRVSSSFSWHDLDGNDSLCECCDSGDCGYSVQVTRPHSGSTAFLRCMLVTSITNANAKKNKRVYLSLIGTEHEGDATVGPLHTLGVYWPGHLTSPTPRTDVN